MGGAGGGQGEGKDAARGQRLEALRGGRGRAFDDAYRALRNELEAYARAVAGGRSGQADFQPESIVADALAQGMQPALEACIDDQHLAGWLRNAVRHELLDRVDKRKPGELPVDSEGRMAEPRDPHAGPLTELVAIDTRSAEREALGKLLERLHAEAIGENDRMLIDLYVVERLAWGEIARRTGREAGALRVAMNRLRARILPKLFAPLEARLDAPTWRIAEAILVRRLDPAEAAAESGRDQADLRRTLTERVLPAVLEEFGGASTEALLRLTGFRRA